MVETTDINTNKVQRGNSVRRDEHKAVETEEGNLLCLGELESFAAEVTFELGHLVFCGAAAQFCPV